MAKKADFYERMRSKKDEWLLDAWKNQKDYEAEAVEALRQLLEERNLLKEATQFPLLQDGPAHLGDVEEHMAQLGIPDPPNLREWDITPWAQAEKPYSFLCNLEVPRRKPNPLFIIVSLLFILLMGFRLVSMDRDNLTPLLIVGFVGAGLSLLIRLAVRSGNKRKLVLLNAFRPATMLEVIGGRSSIVLRFPIRHRFFAEVTSPDLDPRSPTGVTKHFVVTDDAGRVALHLFEPVEAGAPALLEGWEVERSKVFTYKGPAQFEIVRDGAFRIDVLKAIVQATMPQA